MEKFTLDLCNNCIGKNLDDFRYFGDALKYLPNNLKYIELPLLNNKLGKILRI